MMTMLEEAIIYATVMHQGKKRKLQNRNAGLSTTICTNYPSD